MVYARERPGMSAFAIEQGFVYHTYSTSAREWTAFGACTSGSTAHPRGATRRAAGGDATTSTRAERRHGYRRATAGLEILAMPFPTQSERAGEETIVANSAVMVGCPATRRNAA
jgi:hypothetical protein